MSNQDGVAVVKLMLLMPYFQAARGAVSGTVCCEDYAVEGERRG